MITMVSIKKIDGTINNVSMSSPELSSLDATMRYSVLVSLSKGNNVIDITYN